jgi:hypothetical protein
MKPGPVRDAQQMEQCVYNVPRDCGRRYIGKSSRPSEVGSKEHKHNLTQRLLRKSKLVQHGYEEGHRLCWKEAKVLQIESNTTYRKYKETAYVSLVAQPAQLGHLSHLEFITEAEVRKLQVQPV